MNREYVVTETRSEAYSPDHLPEAGGRTFRCVFRCVPSTVDPLPKKPEPPASYPAEPAIVIGPTRGDPSCTRLGRLRVRLRWTDSALYSADANAGTCWVDWHESWGGDGYGTQGIPRVGSEVMVHFAEGGQPYAMAQMRSRDNAPTFRLPREATKVGIKTRTVPNGAESEISIDDDPSSEQILVRAAGDFVTEVTKNTATQLHGAYDLTVDGERRERNEENATFVFAKDVTTGAFGTLREEVGKERVEIVLGSATENIVGDLSQTVDGRVETLTRGTRTEAVGGDSLERHHGHRAESCSCRFRASQRRYRRCSTSRERRGRTRRERSRSPPRKASR